MEQGIVKYFIICESCGHVHRNTEIVNCDACGADVSVKQITANNHINPPQANRNYKAITIVAVLLLTGIICVLMHTILLMAVALLFVRVLISKSPVSPTLRFIAPISLVVSFIYIFLPLFVLLYFTGDIRVLLELFRPPLVYYLIVFIGYAIWIYRAMKESAYLSRMDTNLYTYEDKTLFDDECSTSHGLTRVKRHE